MQKQDASTKSHAESTHFPPVVAVLGHVDHGKTTLLDAIRKTSIAEREHGGITQKIGASSVEIMHEGQERDITFIDTPGHEAFTKMRGRGAQAADIALLIVAANDGVKPQTKESIEVLEGTRTPFIAVITKSDLPTANVEKAKQDLVNNGVSLEGYGGEVPVIAISAKTGNNIQELLDLILLWSDMHKGESEKQTVSATGQVKAIVIESKLDTRAGAKATVVVKNGTINRSDFLQIEEKVFKVRTLFNTLGKPVDQGTVGEAVEILGFEEVPPVGGIITNKKEEIKEAASESHQPLKREAVYQKPIEKEVGISVILVADTQGSLEAIVHALPKEIRLVRKKTGEVSEADILLAKSIGAIVLSFNTKLKPDIVKLAFTERVLLQNYTVIYELLDEVKDALEGKILSQMEQVYGKAKVLAKFPYEKTFAYGVALQEGRLARSDRVRIVRGEEVIGEGSITSLRVGKNPTSKVDKGEAGVIISPELDILVGDVIISHS